ncbi:uncharacterized protein DSM5745_05812 [Aspergillus mulundensis]|uniref:Uncharacterized protein n=1 Tax=Aspergillus mulundensis TaxID=1810919 RepID=A0A3D8RYM4_9EURO|nr:hypothetical protein DSM5745_05812 [Aspergillus mulundensis]RDW78960.1 hypothetical protein DSM5745_05812 [Aspergillus mulundensis]
MGSLSPSPSSQDSSATILSLTDQIRLAALSEAEAEAKADTSSHPNPETHAHLLSLLDTLRLTIETPAETARRIIYQPPQNAALRVLLDLRVFELLMEHADEDEDGVSVQEIVQRTGAEGALVVRLMRVAVALGLASQSQSQCISNSNSNSNSPGRYGYGYVYRRTSKTPIMTSPLGRDGGMVLYDLTMPTLASLPSYFSAHAYNVPTEASCPMRWTTGQSQFEWLGARPAQQERFNAYMGARRMGSRAWFEVFPVQKVFGDLGLGDRDGKWKKTVGTGKDQGRDDGEGGGESEGEGDVFIVDIGGNEGHDLVALRKRYPGLRGRLVLQDLPAVVQGKDTELDRYGIEVMGYNFFEPQPVRGPYTPSPPLPGHSPIPLPYSTNTIRPHPGARIYYLRSILHDWPDATCLKILRNIIPAMSPSSRLILVEFVLPDTHTPLFQAALDVQMMCLGAGGERSRAQWEMLLGEAGLEIQGVWGGGGGERVIEVGLADAADGKGGRMGRGEDGDD